MDLLQRLALLLSLWEMPGEGSSEARSHHLAIRLPLPLGEGWGEGLYP